MLDRLRAHAGVGVTDRAELVVRVLEEVRVHGAHAQVGALDVLTQRGEVIDGVPREVQRDRARGAGEAVDLGGVVDALEHVARASGLREGGEARPGVPVAPRRRLDDELGEQALDLRLVRHGRAPPIR